MIERWLNRAAALAAALVVLGIVGAAQTRPPDREIHRQVRFASGQKSVLIKKRIRLGTTHIYLLRARAGQRMRVLLTAAGRTSFTVYAPVRGIIDEADGTRIWQGRLKETGVYRIAIGTDETADYALRIDIR